MNAIVFYNGWGMNENIISDIQIPLNYDLINVSYPYSFDKNLLNKYEKTIFIGWSFGVYYLSKFLNENRDVKKLEVISINGTPETIGKNGIGEKIFDLTLTNMNEENLKKFYENMAYKGKIENKNISSLISELKFLKDTYNPQENFITKAIISTEDKIIKTKNQERYYKEKNIKIYKIDGGHYIFDKINSWQDIINI